MIGSETFDPKEISTVEGIQKLAFGKINDAARILPAVRELGDEMISRLDLFPVSEIKQNKDGSLEVRFYDRLKALEMLARYEEAGEDRQNTFYGALESAAKSVCEPDEI